MALGIEEDLGVTHPIVGSPVEVGGHEVIEVIRGAEDLATLVVDVEERLEVAEPVGGMDLVDVLERQRQPVSGGEAEHHVRLQRALYVDMQLRLGKTGDQIIHDRDLIRGDVLWADGTRLSSFPEAARIAAATAAVEEMVGGSPTPFAPKGPHDPSLSIKRASTSGASRMVGSK